MKSRQASVRKIIGYVSVVVSLVVGVLALTAWTGGTTATTNNNSPGSLAASRCVTAAAAGVAKATKVPVVPSPGPKIDIAKNHGKSVWLILPLVNPLLSATAQGFTAAAKFAGLRPTTFDGQATVTSWDSGLAEAVAQHASVIITYAIPWQLVSTPLKSAVAAHIKLIDLMNGDPHDALYPGVYAHVTGNFTNDGAVATDLLLDTTSCRSDIGIYGITTLTDHNDLIHGAQAQAAKLCPSCATFVGSLDEATLATSVEPQIATMLRAHPQIKAIFPVFDEVEPYAQDAVNQVDPSVKIVAHDGVAAQLSSLRSRHTSLIGDISFPRVSGWGGSSLTQRSAECSDCPGFRSPTRWSHRS